MFTWEQRWFPSLNRNQGNVSSLRLKRERWKEEEEHPQMNKSNASAFVSWYVPLEPSSSNAFWLPLPSTAKNHLPCYLGGVGRQMNGPMALSVGRVKEANKQKTPKNSSRGSVRCCEEAEEEINTSVRLSFYEKVGETSYKSTHTVWAESIPAAGLLGFMSLQKRCCRKVEICLSMWAGYSSGYTAKTKLLNGL